MKKILLLALLTLFVVACEDIISVPDISGDTIILVAPSAGVILDEQSVQFSWEGNEFADEYQMQIATPSFAEANQIVLDTILSDSMKTLKKFEKFLMPNEYEWSVRATNSEYQTNYTSSSFIVNSQTELSEQTVSIISPIDGFVTANTSVNLQWEELSQATLYRVIITDLNTGDIFLEQTTSNGVLVVNFAPSNYIWKVRAENTSQNTIFTEQTITIL